MKMTPRNGGILKSRLILLSTFCRADQRKPIPPYQRTPLANLDRCKQKNLIAAVLVQLFGGATLLQLARNKLLTLPTGARYLNAAGLAIQLA